MFKFKKRRKINKERKKERKTKISTTYHKKGERKKKTEDDLGHQESQLKRVSFDSNSFGAYAKSKALKFLQSKVSQIENPKKRVCLVLVVFVFFGFQGKGKTRVWGVPLKETKLQTNKPRLHLFKSQTKSSSVDPSIWVWVEIKPTGIGPLLVLSIYKGKPFGGYPI